jgi:hypothetical protein
MKEVFCKCGNPGRTPKHPYCRECTAMAARKYREENRERVRARERRWWNEHPDFAKAYRAKMKAQNIERYPEKYKARTIFSRAIRHGKIQRPSECSLCGLSCTPEGHHHDYSKPLDVIWLCKNCHWKEELKSRPKTYLGREYAVHKRKAYAC